MTGPAPAPSPLLPCSPQAIGVGELTSPARAALARQPAEAAALTATAANVTYGVDEYENNAWFSDATTKFHIIKALEYRVDYRFAARWPLAAQQGWRGAYCFGHPSLPGQAASFCNVMKEYGFDPARDRVWLDHEDTDGRSPSYCAGWAQDFCATVRSELGAVPGVYSYTDFIRQGNCAGLGAYPLWYAYPAVAGQVAQMFPLGPWDAAVLHQYAVTSIDWDAFLGDEAALAAFWAGGAVTPPAPPQQPVLKHWAVAGNWSLNQEASAHGTTAAVIIYLTCRNETAYQHDLATYIQAGNWDAKLPAGVIIYVRD